MASPLVDVDPLALALAYLSTHPELTEALGGSGRVGGKNEPPYPRVIITDPPGGPGGYRWLVSPLLQMEVLGDLDGRPGKALLRRAAFIAATELFRLPEIPTVPGQPVITAFESVTDVAWSPLPTKQPRYTASFRLYVHPPH